MPQETLQEIPATQGQIFRRGLGLKKEVAAELTAAYASAIVDYFRAHDYRLQFGETEIYLAKEFGFCYGVDRAVEYAYQTRRKFPDRRVFLTGEIIHNPHVNQRMLDMGIEFLTGQYANGNGFEAVQPEDVVILPAFGVTIDEMRLLQEKGCILVDTTCGSVLNVWKRVAQYARDGFTSVIHGKYWHEETRATCSQTQKYPNAHYLVVLDMEETETLCAYIAERITKAEFMAAFRNAMSPGFDPEIHLLKIGVANQTTMLSDESLAIGRRIEQELRRKYGAGQIAAHFRTFDTICSATQERQDAIIDLAKNHQLDVMLILGGYNSSNTGHLAEIACQYTSAYHIDDARCLLSAVRIRHKPVGETEEGESTNWLPEGALRIGITAGASTPNNKIGEVIARLAELRRIPLEQLISASTPCR